MNKVFSINDLNAAYGKADVLRNITFDVTAGEFIALIGPNGAGKSTLLKTMMGLLPMSSGSAALNDKPLEELSVSQIARELSAVNRIAAAAPLYSVQDFAAMGLFPHQGAAHLNHKEDIERINETLSLCGIAHLRRRPLAELSGGELQLAFIARALLQNRKLILLDEPVSYLDVKHITMIMDLLYKLNETGSTIIAALHDVNLASFYCGRIIALKEGRLFFDGAPAKVMDAELIESLFDIRCKIAENPVTGKPYVWFVSDVLG